MPSSPLNLRYGTALVVNDIQYPYIDWPLWETTVEIASDAQVDKIIWAGDLLDFDSISTWPHDPYDPQTLPVLESVSQFHAKVRAPLLQAVGDVDEVWLDGNHEYRLERAVEAKLPQLKDYLSPKRVLLLPDSVEYVPYGPRIGHYLTPELLICHGWAVSQYSAFSARKHYEQTGFSVVHGHTHRVGTYHWTNARGHFVAVEAGHMSDPAKVPSVHGHGIPNWQSAAGTLVRYAKDGDSFDIEVNEVFGDKKRKVIANNREYTIG